MPEITTSVRIGLLYQDGTTRNYTFEGVADSVLPDVANKIKAINANSEDNFHKTFVSNDGSPVLRIGSGQITSTEETVIYTG